MTMYYTNISAFRDELLFRQLYQTLPPCRKEKIDRLKPEGERCRSLGAGLLLKHACEDYGMPGEDGALSLNEFGRPSFTNRPEVHFSLSHSGNWVICVLSPLPVGCDVEQVKPYNHAIPKRVFTAEECRWLAKEEENKRGDGAFCRVWTLKESFLQVTGKGFAFPITEASFSFENGDICFHLHGEQNHSYSFFEWNGLPECCASVCLQSEETVLPEIIPVSFS